VQARQAPVLVRVAGVPMASGLTLLQEYQEWEPNDICIPKACASHRGDVGCGGLPSVQCMSLSKAWCARRGLGPTLPCLHGDARCAAA